MVVLVSNEDWADLSPSYNGTLLHELLQSRMSGILVALPSMRPAGRRIGCSRCLRNPIAIDPYVYSETNLFPSRLVLPIQCLSLLSSSVHLSDPNSA